MRTMMTKRANSNSCRAIANLSLPNAIRHAGRHDAQARDDVRVRLQCGRRHLLVWLGRRACEHCGWTRPMPLQPCLVGVGLCTQLVADVGSCYHNIAVGHGNLLGMRWMVCRSVIPQSLVEVPMAGIQSERHPNRRPGSKLAQPESTGRAAEVVQRPEPGWEGMHAATRF